MVLKGADVIRMGRAAVADNTTTGKADSMTEYSDGFARQLEDILEDLSAGRLTVQQAAESIRRQSPQMLHRPVRQRPRSVGVVIATVGVLFLGMAGMIGAQSYQFMTNGVKTQATVIELNLKKGRPRPRYEYVVNGSTYSGAAAVGMDQPGLKVGDSIEIEYLPESPAESRVASWGERWTGTLAVGVMGGVVALVGAFVIALTRRPTQ